MARVLVVDDEPLIALLLCDWLEELGHEAVGPANTLQAAFGLIESDRINAAVLDLSVRGEATYGVADVLLQRGIPFLFLTGHGPDRVGAPYNRSPVLTKPVDFDAMRDAIARLLDSSS
jgi:CheY-like chemotaxis protein